MHRLCTLPLLYLLACAPQSGPEQPQARTPALTSASLTCDTDAGLWSLLAAADAWTDGATLAWTPDGEQSETHPVPSIAQASDGSSDRLALTLGIVAAPEQVSPGATTAYSCIEQPSAQLVLNAPDGSRADCMLLGTTTYDIAALREDPPCEPAD